MLHVSPPVRSPATTHPSDAERPRVVIVGGGFSGAALAIQLARAGSVDVTLVEPDAVGRGVAYAADPAHLLNVPAARMSLFPDVPEDFLAWAWMQGVDAAPASFLPRALYGAYVADTFALAASTTRVVRTRVQTIEPGGPGWRVLLTGGDTIDADVVVLATGNPPPATPASVAALVGDPRYVADPWRPDALARIDATDPVLLVGTGLTALDVLVSLRERGHRGPIRALSRRGLLPLPHLEAGGPPPAPAVPLPAVLPLEGLVRVLHAAGRAAAGNGEAWQGVVDGLRAATPTIWAGLTPVERRRFLRHLRPYWEVHRHRAPAVVLRYVRALQASGALEIVAGHVVAVSADLDGIAVAVRRRGADVVEQARYTHVVNTTGPDTDLGRSGGSLLRGLLARGILLQDADHLGLRTTGTSAALRADGTAHPDLFVLGQARRADLWEHTAVPDLAKGAAALASHLTSIAAARAAG